MMTHLNLHDQKKKWFEASRRFLLFRTGFSIEFEAFLKDFLHEFSSSSSSFAPFSSGGERECDWIITQFLWCLWSNLDLSLFDVVVVVVVVVGHHYYHSSSPRRVGGETCKTLIVVWWCSTTTKTKTTTAKNRAKRWTRTKKDHHDWRRDNNRETTTRRRRWRRRIFSNHIIIISSVQDRILHLFYPSFVRSLSLPWFAWSMLLLFMFAHFRVEGARSKVKRNWP